MLEQVGNAGTNSGFIGAYNKFIDFLAFASALLTFGFLFGWINIQLWNMFCIILCLFYLVEYMPDLSDAKKKWHHKAWAIFVMAIGIAPNIYLLFNIARIRVLFGSVYTTADVVFGSMAILSTLIWTKRKFGWAMPGIAIVFIAYVLLGHNLPRQFMGHSGFGFPRFVSFIFSDAALYGILVGVVARVIFLYLLFGSFLNNSGIGQYMIDLSMALAGRYRGGPAKVVVFASALLATINGNSVANVATTGVVTIPMMKKVGYTPHFAGAVEAVASTGGQILPPVMGAGAFIMAEFLGVSFAVVARAALIPALLFYVAVYLLVDLEAVKKNLIGLQREELPELKQVLKKIYMLTPVAVIVYLLMISRTSVTRAGLIAIAVTVVVSWFSKEYRMGPKRIYEAMVDGAKSTIPITSTCMTAGIVIGAITMSGLATRFASMALRMADGNILLTAICVAVICIVLGLGLPTTAAYVITAAVAVPIMSRVGIDPLAAHLFVFYFAILSAITPPIAGASFAAATIAKAPIMKTCFESVRLGIVAYIIPFFFIFDTSLIGQGSWYQVLLAIITSVAGCIFLAMSIQGVTFMGHTVNVIVRILWVAGALMLIDPNWLTNLYGIGLLVLGLFIVFILNRSGFHKNSAPVSG